MTRRKLYLCAEPHADLIPTPIALGRRLALLWAAGFYVTNFLKDLLKLPRPYHVNDYIANIERRRGERFGLPCAKAFSAACLPLYLALATQTTSPPILALLLVLAWCAAVTSARIYMGTHTPADVIAGMCLGIAFAILWLQFGERIDGAMMQSALAIGAYGVVGALAVVSYPHPPFFSPDLTEVAMVLGYSIGWLVGGQGLLLLSAFVGAPVWNLPPASGLWASTLRCGVGLILLAQVRENVEPVLGRAALAKPLKFFGPRIDANAEAILRHSHARHLLVGLFGDFLPASDPANAEPSGNGTSGALSSGGGGKANHNGGGHHNNGHHNNGHGHHNGGHHNGHHHHHHHAKGDETKEPPQAVPSPPDEPENMHSREAWQRKASTAVPVYAGTYLVMGFAASFAAPLLITAMGI
mmetsp:Transcript_27838/g.88463  ORF Transcript_27838/g.88463 Transcript_27838/m.88463 type:complete len:412 (-) Transcript_27838:3450-4685(-)